MELRENASNAGFYNCPQCLHGLPERDPNPNPDDCMTCVKGNHFIVRPQTSGERFYNSCQIQGRIDE